MVLGELLGEKREGKEKPHHFLDGSRRGGASRTVWRKELFESFNIVFFKLIINAALASSWSFLALIGIMGIKGTTSTGDLRAAHGFWDVRGLGIGNFLRFWRGG